MKKVFAILVILGGGGEGYGQQTIFSRSDATTGNWWDVANPWFRQCDGWWIDRPDKVTCSNNTDLGRNNVIIDHNVNTTMTTNGAFFQLRTLTLENGASINRTFNNDGGGISLIIGLYNESAASHTFNTDIGVDATNVSFQARNASGSLSFGQNFYLNANTAAFGGPGNISISGVLSGTNGQITKAGSGMLALSGNNTYTGPTTVTEGTLQLAASGVIPDASNFVLNGGTLSSGSSTGFSETMGSLTLSSNSTISLGTGSHSLIFSNSSGVSWSSAVLKITGWEGFYNGTAGTGGRIFIGSSSESLTAAQLLQINFINGGVSYTATLLGSGELVPTSTQALFWGGTTTENWVSGGKWSLENGGPFTSNWTNGRTAVFNEVNSSITITSTGPQIANITAFENVNTTYTSGNITTGGIQLPIYVAGGKTLDFAGTLISTALGTGIIKNGGGIFISSNSNTYPGGFTLNDGIMVVGSVNAMGNGGSLNINGGTIAANASRNITTRYSGINIGGDFSFGNATYSSNITLADNVSLGNSVTRTFTLGGTGTYTLNGIISGTGSNLVLAATAAGTLSLGGANTYGGSTTINNGTLNCNAPNTLPSTTDVILANTSGANLSLGASSQIINSLSGGGTNGGNVSVANGGVLTVSGTPSTTFSGVISGTGALVKNGTGVFTLANAANNISGTTTISGGELRVNPISNATYESQIILNGGKFSTTGIMSNTSWTSSSTLQLSATSSIDLGSNAHTITFANSSGITWTGSTTLTINGWTGTSESSGIAGRIFFGNSSTTLSAAQLSQITFNGYTGTPILLSTGELVPGIGVIFTWNGSNGSDWETAANWTPSSGSGTPGLNDLVIIPGSYTNALVITSNHTCNSFTVASNGAFSIATGSTLTVTGNFVYNSTFNSSFDCTSTLTLSSPFSQNIPALNYGNLNLAGGPRVLASSGTIGICGTYTPGTSTTVTGSTVSFNGATLQSVPIAHSYATLNIANTTSTIGLAGTPCSTSFLSIVQNARLNVALGQTLNVTGATSTIDGILRNGGTLSFTNSPAFSSTGIYEHNIAGGTIPAATWNAGSTCEIIGASTTAPGGLGQAFHHFVWNCAGQIEAVPLGGNPNSINGNFEIRNTNSLLLNLTAGTDASLTVSGDVLLTGGNLNLTSGTGNSTLFIGGNLLVNGLHTINKSGTGFGLIEFNGSTNQLITIPGTGNVINQVNFRVNNPEGISIGTGSTLPINGGTTLQISRGNVTREGTAIIVYGSTGGVAVLEYNPSGNSAISTKDEWPTTGLRRLRINSTSSQPITLNASRTMGSDPLDVINFDNGRLALGDFNLILNNNDGAALTVTSGYAETNGTGQLFRTILSSENNTYLFPVGNGTAYTPMSLNFATNSLAGRQVGVRSVGVVHPNMAPNPADYINNRYWVTTLNDATGTYTYTPSFTHLTPGDVMGTQANIRLSRFSGGVWSNINASNSTGTILAATAALTQTTGSLANGQWSGRAVKTPQTYTWVSPIDGSWTNNTNWSPSAVPSGEDIVQFTHTGTRIIDNVPTNITLGKMSFSGGGTTTFATNAAGNLNLFGGTNPLLEVAAGTTWIVSGDNTINTNIIGAGTGLISGTVQLRAALTTQVNHTLEAENTGAITFENGSFFTAGSTANNNFAGNPFGDAGTTNTVVFQSGSTFEQNTGGNPFGLAQPNSKVVFNAGSTYRYSDNRAGLFQPSISGRNYGHFIFNSTITKNPEGGAANWSMQDLRVINTGLFGINLGVNGNITGNIEVASGGLSFAPSSGSSIITMNGSTAQNIGGPSGFTIGANATMNINNTIGVTVLNNMIINGTMQVLNSAICNIQGEINLSGAGDFNLLSGGTLGIGSADGLYSAGATGNVRTTNRSFSSAATLRYTGSANQSTGNFITTPTNNTLAGLTNLNLETVTLAAANNALTVTNLNLQAGTFRVNTTQQLNIAAGGNLTATAGNLRNNAEGGTVNFIGAATVNATGTLDFWNTNLQAGSGGVDFGATGAPTIHNELVINSGRFVNLNAPFYETGSTLRYNTGSTGVGYGRSVEWNATSGRGYPHHVAISGTTALNPARADNAFTSTAFNCGGDLTIEAGSALDMNRNANNMTVSLFVAGNINLYGQLSGSGLPGSDIRIAGEWTRYTGGTFNPNNRAVWFNGSANQTITNNTGTGGLETFAYMVIDKSTGNLQLSGAPNPTNILVNGNAAGNNLQLLRGNIDLNGRQFEWGGNGNLQTDAALRQIFSTTPATFLVTGGDRAVLPSNAGKLLFNDQTTVIISAGLNFAPSTTTINGTLQINTNGFANINAPIYGPQGVLIYNTGGIYDRRVEWNGTQGEPGYPNDVIVRNNTTIFGGGPAGEAVSRVFAARRDVTIEPGSVINMAGSHNMNSSFVVGRDLFIQGTLVGSNNPGSDIKVGRNWFRSGTFTPNSRAVFFDTDQNGEISNSGGTETFPYVVLHKNTASNTLTLNQPVNISGKLTLTSGRMITSETNILRITNTTPDDANNGIEVTEPATDNAYVQGPLWRHTAVADGSYLLPVGKPDGPYRQYRPVVIRTKLTTPSQFYGDYRVETPPYLGPPDGVKIGGFIAGIINREYWQVDREPMDGTPAWVTLQYLRPPTATPEHWTYSGPEGTANNVAVVKLYDELNGLGVPVKFWYFTKGSADPTGQFASNQIRWWQDEGPITSFELNTFSPFGIGHASYTVLPLRLLSFTASMQQGDGLLHWQLADASSLRQFEVEHSTDGHRFNPIGRVMPNGNTTFTYRHASLPPGVHYYRLRMVEKDGRQTFSRIELLQVGSNRTIIAGLMHNPVVGGQAMLRVYSARAQQAEATLIDMSGRMLLRQQVQLQAGANQPAISLMVIPAGTYRLIFRTADGIEKAIPLIK